MTKCLLSLTVLSVVSVAGTSQAEERFIDFPALQRLQPVPQAGFDDEDGKKRLQKKLIGSEWRIIRNGLTFFFEDDRRFGVSDWGKRRGIWMVVSPNRVGAVGYAGSHQDIVFKADLSSATLYVDGLPFSELKPPLKPRAKIPSGPLFESVLGVYGKAIRGPRVPFVNLRPPNRNLWTAEIEDRLKGTLGYGDVDYIGTATLIIPETGIYTVDLPDSGVEFRLNGQRIIRGDHKLLKGAYDVRIYTNHWGQPYLKYAHARVFPKGRKQPIPFVNSGADIEEFLSSKIGEEDVVEVCRFPQKRVSAQPADE